MRNIKDFKISLKAARINARLTQVEAAERIGVTKETIINWEKSKSEPKLKQVKRLAEIYNIPVELLIV